MCVWGGVVTFCRCKDCCLKNQIRCKSLQNDIRLKNKVKKKGSVLSVNTERVSVWNHNFF